MKKVIFSQEQLQDMIHKYQEENYSTRQLGEYFGVSKTVISRVLKENNIVLDHTNRKYQCDINIFENIDTAEKAYWLGFIAADGCNYQRDINASIIINIHRKDREHLEKFKKFVKGDSLQIVDHIQNQGFSNNTPMSKITINSIKMSKDLSNLGVTPRKSLTLQPPKIDNNFALPYILGYFDGDGSIFQTKQNEFGINIEGTKETLEWINNILNISNKLEKRKDDNTNNYYIRCGGIQKPYQILKQLYNSVDIHLDRKYEIFTILETVVFNRNIK